MAPPQQQQYKRPGSLEPQPELLPRSILPPLAIHPRDQRSIQMGSRQPLAPDAAADRSPSSVASALPSRALWREPDRRDPSPMVACLPAPPTTPAGGHFLLRRLRLNRPCRSEQPTPAVGEGHDQARPCPPVSPTSLFLPP